MWQMSTKLTDNDDVLCQVYSSTRLIPEVDSDYMVVKNKCTYDSLFKFFSS